MESKVHLLVHAGAPASRSADDKYVAQAKAYLDLDTAVLSRVQVIPTVETPELSMVFEATSCEIQNVNQGLGLRSSTSADSYFIEDTQLAYMAMQSQLPSSAFASSDRRPAGRATARRKLVDTDPDTVVPDSTKTRTGGEARVFSQSSYLTSPVLDRVSKKARLDSPSGGTVNLEYPALSQSCSGTSQQGQAGMIVDSPASCDGNETSSELPTSYSLSEKTSKGSIERPQLSARSSSDPGPLSHGSIGSDRSKRHVHDENSPQPPAIHQPSTVPVGTKPKQQPKVLVPPSSVAGAQLRPILNESAAATLRELSLEVYPQGPETAVDHFTSHVTPTLEQLAHRSAVADTYKPVMVSRELNIMERGHWNFSCSQWSFDQKVDFWRMLEDVVKSGRVGWGVWCTRSQDLNCDEAEPAVLETPDTSFGLVRVYCWGEVAKHIYLLLYVVSKSKVRRLGLRWMDSERKVVIQMPARQS